MSYAAIYFGVIGIGVVIVLAIWAVVIAQVLVCDYNVAERRVEINPHKLVVVVCCAILIAMIVGWVK